MWPSYEAGSHDPVCSWGRRKSRPERPSRVTVNGVNEGFESLPPRPRKIGRVVDCSGLLSRRSVVAPEFESRIFLSSLPFPLLG